MGYSGAFPSEDSSGERIRRGGITKSGNAHLRRIVVESAWNYWRRRGLGQLAEVFGPAFVEQDKATRLFSLSWRYESRMGLLLERCTGDCDSFRRWHQCLH